MSVLLVQTANDNDTGSNTTATITLTNPTGLNNLVIVNIKVGSSSVSGLSVTDNAPIPNTYSQAIQYAGGNNVMYQFYGVQVSPGATHIIITWTSNNSVRAIADEFSGLGTNQATVFDTAVHSNGTGTSSSVSGFSPANNGELISMGLGTTTGISAFVAGTNYVTSTSTVGLSAEYRLNGTTSETAPASWTTTSAWLEVAGAYKTKSNNGNFLPWF